MGEVLPESDEDMTSFSDEINNKYMQRRRKKPRKKDNLDP